MTGLPRSTVRIGVETRRTLVGKPWRSPSSGTDRAQARPLDASSRTDASPPKRALRFTHCCAPVIRNASGPGLGCRWLPLTQPKPRSVLPHELHILAGLQVGLELAGFDRGFEGAL